MCMGSRCGFWRWASRDLVVAVKATGDTITLRRPVAMERGMDVLEELPDQGYCGGGGPP